MQAGWNGPRTRGRRSGVSLWEVQISRPSFPVCSRPHVQSWAAQPFLDADAFPAVGAREA